MAEPLAIIGAVGAVANTIDLVSKTINAIRDFRGRWKEADLALVSLTAQLTALRAALKKVQEWSETELSSDHDYQLIMDLDDSLSCCRLLVGKFDEFFVGLDRTSDGPFDFAGKVKFVFGTKELEGVQKMVEHQISALTLLLTTCHCSTSSERRTLLQDPKNRKVIEQMGRDSASLIVQRDSSSFISAWSDNLSRFSMCFEFDRGLLSTRVYERVFRSSVKNAIRRPQRLTSTSQEDSTAVSKEDPSMMTREQLRLSKTIDKQLAIESRRRRRELRLLLLGDPDSVREDVMRQIRTNDIFEFKRQGLEVYRSPVRQSVIRYAKALVKTIRADDAVSESEVQKGYYEFLLGYNMDPNPNTPMGNDVVEALEALCEHMTSTNLSLTGDGVVEALDALWEDTTTTDMSILSDSMTLLLQDIRRITASDYIPTESDIERSGTRPTGVQEYLLNGGSHGWPIRLIDAGPLRFQRKKWPNLSENALSTIFIVDLACYDDICSHSECYNSLLKQLCLFESLVSPRRSRPTSIMLVLGNLKEFEEKLAKCPLQSYFPDYTGGKDVDSAVDYVLWRFKQVKPSNVAFYSHKFNSTGEQPIVKRVSALIDDSIRNIILSGLSISPMFSD